MKPAFFTDGKTTTHSALSKRSRGIPLSGIPRISLRTSRDSFRRSSSFCCANAGKAKQKQTTSAMRFFMKPPYTSCRRLGCVEHTTGCEVCLRDVAEKGGVRDLQVRDCKNMKA